MTPFRSPSARRVLLFLGAALLSVGYVSLFRWTWVDDAMITLTYARNLAEGAGFSLTGGITHYGFTSPLNVLLLAAVGKLVGFDQAITVATAGLIVALFWAARRLSDAIWGRPSFGLGLTVMIVVNPLISSTFGLEVLLGAVGSVLLVEALVTQRPRFCGLVLGLLILTRPDYGSLAVAALLFAPVSSPATPGPGRGARDARISFHPDKLRWWIRAASVAAVPVVLWHGFAWIALGSALPVTLFIKQAQAPWEVFTMANGWWLYLREAPLPAFGAIAPLALLFCAFLPRARSDDRAMVAVRLGLILGSAHFLGLALLMVPPYHWYYGPSLCLLLIAAWAALFASIHKTTRRRPVSVAAVSACALPLVLLVATRGLPLDEAPIHTNWVRHRDYRDMAEWLSKHVDPSTPIQIDGEVGTLSYYSRLALFDDFGHPGALPELEVPDGGSRPPSSGRWKAVNFLFHPGSEPLAPELCLRGVYHPERPFTKPTIKQWTFATNWTEIRWVLGTCADLDGSVSRPIPTEGPLSGPL